MAIAKGIQFIAELRKGVQAIDPAMQGTEQIFPNEAPPPSYNLSLREWTGREFYGTVTTIFVPAGIYPLANATETIQLNNSVFYPLLPGYTDGYQNTLLRTNGEILGKAQIVTSAGTLNPSADYVALVQESKTPNIEVTINSSADEARFTLYARSMSADTTEQGRITFRIPDTEHYFALKNISRRWSGTAEWGVYDSKTGQPFFERVLGKGTYCYDNEQPDYSKLPQALNITGLQYAQGAGEGHDVVVGGGVYNKLHYVAEGMMLPYSSVAHIEDSTARMEARLHSDALCWEYQNREIPIPLVFDKTADNRVRLREATPAETSAVVCTIKYRPNTEIIEELNNR